MKDTFHSRRRILAGTARIAAAFGIALAERPGRILAADRLPRPTDSLVPKLFNSFFLGGFECSTHRRRDGRRLDVIAATQHDLLAEADYRQLSQLGIRSVRDGLRWHLIEAHPGRYDWSSFLPMLRAARATRTQIMWDLCHYGWPDHIDIWSAAFVTRFARFAGAVAKLVREESDQTPFYVPVNEISFWAWAGGHVGFFNPSVRGRADELKAQLVRASIAAIEAIWAVDRRARIVHVEPVIHEIADPSRPHEAAQAESYRLAQYQSWDMLIGKVKPDLGGKPAYLDILGANYYPVNQRIYRGRFIDIGDPLYRPFHDLLAEVYDRYRRPMLIAETGVEFDRRPAWLRYIAEETRRAMMAGVPIEGICWYPILNHPGWEDDRHTQGGLLDYPDANGKWAVYAPLAAELKYQQLAFARSFEQNRPAVLRCSPECCDTCARLSPLRLECVPSGEVLGNDCIERRIGTQFEPARIGRDEALGPTIHDVLSAADRARR